VANVEFNDRPQHNALYEVTVNPDDTFTFHAADWNDTIILKGEGEATAYLGSGNDSFDASHLYGSAEVHGGAGADTILGAKGADHLFGGDGQDTILGGKGCDYLDGGQGKDVLTGGAGADTFHIQKYVDALYSHDSGQGVDIITDFSCHDNPLKFDGWGDGLHWDSTSANFLDRADNVIAHLTGLEGTDLVRTEFDAVTHHQEWFFV